MGRYVLTPAAYDMEHALSVRVALDELADDILRDAQAYCPVDSGYLRASGFAENGRVGFTADYAGYVEFGTRHMNAQPFLTPAALKYRGAL